jgi:hypothetical protein
VVLGEAAEVAAHEALARAGRRAAGGPDDHEAAARSLDSEDFYADCRGFLTDDGCMTVNLFGRSSS